MKSYDELKTDGDAFLEHYGVKGMKWRRRKKRTQAQSNEGKNLKARKEGDLHNPEYYDKLLKENFKNWASKTTTSGPRWAINFWSNPADKMRQALKELKRFREDNSRLIRDRNKSIVENVVRKATKRVKRSSEQKPGYRIQRLHPSLKENDMIVGPRKKATIRKPKKRGSSNKTERSK